MPLGLSNLRPGLSQRGGGGAASYSADVTSYQTTVDALRAAESQPALSASALTLLDDYVSFLKGTTTDWSTNNGLTPVNVWDDIVIQTILIPDFNVGAGANVASLVAPNSLGVPTVAPTDFGSAAVDFTWGTFFTGNEVKEGVGAAQVLVDEDYVKFPLNGYAFQHDSADPGLWMNAYGFGTDRQLHIEAGDTTSSVSLALVTTAAAGGNGQLGVNGLKMLGWRGPTVQGFEGFVWNQQNGGTFAEQLTNFGVPFFQGAAGAGMLNGVSVSQNIALFNSGDTYAYQSTPVEPEFLFVGASIRAYSGGAPDWKSGASYYDMVRMMAAYPSEADARNLLRGDLQFAVDAHTLGNSENQFTILKTLTDGDGIVNYYVVSKMAGHVRIRVKEPTAPAVGKSHRFCYILEPAQLEGQNSFGHGIEHCSVTESYHNDYNMTLIAVDFPEAPWYADHATYKHQRWESFYTDELQPWIEANFGTSGDSSVLVGFSKSGYGGLGLIFRNPGAFEAIAAFDSPTDWTTLSQFNNLNEGTFAYGTQANCDAYQPKTLAQAATAFGATNRIWIGAGNLFATHVSNFDTLLTDESILHTYVASAGTHTWDGGWTDAAFAFLDGAA